MTRPTLAVLALLCLPLSAAGQDAAAPSSDLEVDVRADWVGGRRGGVWPVRIAVTNRGPARAVTAAFVPFERPGDPDRPAVVTKTVTVPAGATASFTLPVPLTARSGNGEVIFAADPLADSGELPAGVREEADLAAAALPELTATVTLPRAAGEAINRPALLIAAAAKPPAGAMDGFEEACERAVGALAGVSERPPERKTVAADGETYAAVDPADWPRTWLGFTAVDIVLVTPAALSEMPADARAALVDWLHAGGAVVVSGAGGRPDAAAWGPLLDLPAAAGGWRFVGETGVEMGEVTGGEGLSGGAAFARVLDALAERPGAVRVRPALAGRVYAVDGRTVGLGGTRQAWDLILADLGADRLTVADRVGAYPRGANSEFYEWLVPGVRGVPVFGFLVLMTGFAVLIGPVNYFWLRRRHQIGRLAVTIPLIAAAAGGALLLLSVTMHGWTAKARRLEVTVHDPDLDRAVTFARTAFFAPRDPGGLAFDPATAVFRLPPPGGADGGGRVDWTDRQRWAGALAPGRTRTQFVTVTPRPERGRLTATGGDIKEGLRVTNGYETDLAHVLASDAAGNLYYGTDLAAGAAATLAPLDGDRLFAWRTALDGKLPERPPGLSKDGLGVLGELGSVFGRRGDPGASFRASLAYRSLNLLRGINEKTDPIQAFAETPLLPTARGAFAAVLPDGDAGTFAGVDASFRGDLRVLLGTLDGEVPGDPAAPLPGDPPAAAAP